MAREKFNPGSKPTLINFISKQAVKSLFFLTVFLSLYFVLYICNRYFLSATTINHWVLVGLVSFLSFVIYDLLYPHTETILDWVFFPRKLIYKHLLEDVSRRLAKVSSRRRLFSLIVHFATLILEVKNAAILYKDQEGLFRLAYQRGYLIKEEIALSVDERNPLISFLENEKQSVCLERLEAVIQESNRGLSWAPAPYSCELLKQEMMRLQSASIIPSFLGSEMKIILLLGERKDKKSFHKDDLALLFQLVQELAISMENSRLYEEALTKSKKLESINFEFSDAQNKLIEALKETEEANKQLQDKQAQLLHEQKMATLGRLSSSVGHEINNPLTILSMNVSRVILKYRKNKDLKVSEVLDVFKKIDSNIGRIKAVVNTLTGLLRKHEKGHMQPLSLKLVLEETLPLVRFQTYMDNLSGVDVDIDIAPDVPLIKGDLERLQEVFLNLFINSTHALLSQREKRITVKASRDEENESLLKVDFSDNGCGMSDEIKKKIFNFRFTTKKEGKGSGIGLYMSKYIIELHGGDIEVISNPDLGTQFIIRIPIFEEVEHEETISH